MRKRQGSEGLNLTKLSDDLVLVSPSPLLEGGYIVLTTDSRVFKWSCDLNHMPS